MKSARALRDELMGRDFTTARRAAKATRERLMNEAKVYGPGEAPPAVSLKRELVARHPPIKRGPREHTAAPESPPTPQRAASIWGLADQAAADESRSAHDLTAE